jgi:hypothetical protein
MRQIVLTCCHSGDNVRVIVVTQVASKDEDDV